MFVFCRFAALLEFVDGRFDDAMFIDLICESGCWRKDRADKLKCDFDGGGLRKRPSLPP